MDGSLPGKGLNKKFKKKMFLCLKINRGIKFTEFSINPTDTNR